MLVRCCPLLMTVPSFPSLSSSPHCPPPSHHCPILPITVPSCLFLLSRHSHHCLLLPITVPSGPSLSPPPHHITLSWQVVFPPEYSSSPQSGQLKELLCVSEVYIPRWSASCSGSRLSGDYLVWARDLDEQCGMYCQPQAHQYWSASNIMVSSTSHEHYSLFLAKVQGIQHVPVCE